MGGQFGTDRLTHLEPQIKLLSIPYSKFSPLMQFNQPIPHEGLQAVRRATHPLLSYRVVGLGFWILVSSMRPNYAKPDFLVVRRMMGFRQHQRCEASLSLKLQSPSTTLISKSTRSRKPQTNPKPEALIQP